jgi:uncharacterized membrane protein (UPF0127 family)
MKIIIPIFLSLVALASASLTAPAQKAPSISSKTVIVSASAPILTLIATSTVQTPKGALSVMIADTDATRQQGLSDRESLPQDVGMLFIFPESRTQSFWMKDMHFPLDIIWIDEYKRVVGIAENVSPDTYPEAFMSPVPIMYVLEVNVGQAAYFGIQKGITLSF